MKNVFEIFILSIPVHVHSDVTHIITADAGYIPSRDYSLLLFPSFITVMWFVPW